MECTCDLLSQPVEKIVSTSNQSSTCVTWRSSQGKAHGGGQTKKSGSPDFQFSRGFFRETGTHVYFRENYFQILGFPVENCLKFTGIPVKTCWKL